MAYHFQDDAFHSQLFENYKSRLVEQKHQNVSQSQNQNQVDRQKQIEDLKKAYSVEKTDPLINVGDIDREDYHIKFTSIKHINPLLVRLQLDYEFPKKRPKFYFERRYDEYYIDPNTLEIKYWEYFPWNPSQSNLTELAKNIEDMLTQSTLSFEDLAQLLAISCENQLNETKKCKELNQLTLEKIFPKIEDNQKDSEYTKLSKQPGYINQCIQGTEEYINLLKSCKEKSDTVINLAQTVQGNYQSLSDLKRKVDQKQKDLNNKLQEYIFLLNEIENIQERFESQAAFAIIDCEIQKLEEQINEVNKDRFSNNLQYISEQFRQLKQKQIFLQLLKQQYLKTN